MSACSEREKWTRLKRKRVEEGEENGWGDKDTD